MFCKGRALKKSQEISKKSIKINANFEWQKKNPKMASEVDLGGSGTPFGRGLGHSGLSFGHFWAHFGRFLEIPNHIFVKHWSKMSSKRPFEWILNHFGKLWGRFWRGLGRNLEGFGAF